MAEQPKRKLIEVALPLEAINAEAAREKSIRQGHPSTLHLWWARRPLAACRAVLFAQLVDDPSAHPDRFPTPEAQKAERQRLFDLIAELVKWESTYNEPVLRRAREEIRKSCGDNPPPVLDPFAGGGSIPLEAQRLGLEAHASDLNPVAVLINKALIEIPPKFAGLPPVNPDDRNARTDGSWRGAEGLAADVRYYGRWMRDEAERRIGHLYPKAKLPDGGEATVIAWIWARTVTCPNPGCRAIMPLVRSFWLGKKKGKEAFVVPIIEGKRVRFTIGHDKNGPPVQRTVSRTGAICLVCEQPVKLDYIRAEGRAKRMGSQLMAVAAEGHRQRVYLAPSEEHEQAADVLRPDDVPDGELPSNPRAFSPPLYGMTKWSDLFTHRQLTLLLACSGLVRQLPERVVHDVRDALAGHSGSRTQARDMKAYADAVAIYLSFAVSHLANRGSSMCSWDCSPGMEALRSVFARQAMSINWDYAEGNPFSHSTGNLIDATVAVAGSITNLPAAGDAHATQLDVTEYRGANGAIATDPPYYDNVGYADLSDYFYIWLRSGLRPILPNIFATIAAPKSSELVADPYRHGGSQQAQEFFESRFIEAFHALAKITRRDLPATVFYAFKQAESKGSEDGVTASTGWETMLEGMLQSGWAVTATWPMHTELGNRTRSIESNALASSIVLTCRVRESGATTIDRRTFIAELRQRMPEALRDLQDASIAPVDLAQAAIGPGMGVFSSHARVLEPDGSRMRVRTALGLINQVLDQVLAEQEGEFDAATRFAITWFEQRGFDPGKFGEADVLARAKGTAVNALEDMGVLTAQGGRVALVGKDELPAGWAPPRETAVPVWVATMHLVASLHAGGTRGAGELLRQVPQLGDSVRDLAYRLYSICDRKGWSSSAQWFNGLVTSWRDVEQAARSAPREAEVAQTLDFG